MIALTIINRYFPQFKDNKYLQREWFITYQTTYAMCVLSYCMYVLLNYFMYGDIQIIKSIFVVIKNYVLLDMLICEKYDVYLHHITTFLICYISIGNDGLFEQLIHFYIVASMTEISTVFLTIREIIKPYRQLSFWKKAYDINNLLFATTFYYTRWYLFYTYGICDKDNFENIRNNVSSYQYYILYNCIYSIFALNIYWGILIGKMIYQKYKKNNA
jgi:TLC domain